MNNHWQLSNVFQDMSKNQFDEFARDFSAYCERVWGSDVKVSVELFDHERGYGSGNPAPDRSERTTLDDLDSLTEDAWNKAAYVRFNVRPADGAEHAPRAAWGSIEAKGATPRSAHFHVQGIFDGADEEYDLMRAYFFRNHPDLEWGKEFSTCSRHDPDNEPLRAAKNRVTNFVRQIVNTPDSF